MPRTLAPGLTFIVLVALPLASAGPTTFDFAAPASMGPDLDVRESSWVLLVFSDLNLHGSMSQSSSWNWTTYTETRSLAGAGPIGNLSSPPTLAQRTNRQATFAGFSAAGPGSLLIEAKSIDLVVSAADALLYERADQTCLSSFVGPDALARRQGRFETMCPAGAPEYRAIAPTGFHVRVTASETATLESHNLMFQCPGSCPNSADRQEISQDTPSGRARQQVLKFHRFSDGASDLIVEGTVYRVLAAAAGTTGHVRGTLRLPSVAESCLCGISEGQTLRLDGQLTLANVQSTSTRGRMTASIDGAVQTARLDEQPLDPASIFGEPMKLAVVAGLVAFGVGLLPKFGRILLAAWPGLNIARPFGNKQRTRLLATIAENPGIDQTELGKQTGVARGTVRHHLRVLVRSDLLAERRVGKRSTYTLNDNSFEFSISPRQNAPTAGTAVAHLRHPQREKLMQIMQDGREVEYLDLARGMAEHGQRLSRSTASYHLNLLARAGLVTRRREGSRVLWKSSFNSQATLKVQRQRFLTLARLSQIFDAIPPTPVDKVGLRKAVRDAGWFGPMRDLQEKVELLVAAGYVQRADDRFFRTVN